MTTKGWSSMPHHRRIQRWAATFRYGAVVLVVAAVAPCLVGTGSAGASGLDTSVPAKNPAFCKALSSQQDISGIGRKDSKKIVRVIKKAAKTNVPAKLKADLKILIALYQRIADGTRPAKAIASGGTKLATALTDFTKYVGKNCSSYSPST
jgi:hypothetical protein